MSLSIRFKLLPNSTNQTLTTKPVTTVSITKDIQFAVEGKFVAFDQIESMLKSRIGNMDQYEEPPTISLHVDKSVPMEHVVKVMNIAKNNRYKLILATSPE